MYQANMEVVTLSFDNGIAQNQHINKKVYHQPSVEIVKLSETDIITNPSSWGMIDGGVGNDDFGDDYDDIS